MDGVERDWRVYLPLGCRVTKLEIGSREPLTRTTHQRVKNPSFTTAPRLLPVPCVSRPGMPHVSQLDRMLDRMKSLTLGFPGMAYCEPEMASAIAELDPVLFVVDCIPNNSPELKFWNVCLDSLSTLRQARPRDANSPGSRPQF